MKQRRKPGDPLTLSSADWNSFLDAAEIVLGGKGNRRDNSNPIPWGNQDVLGKNTTGADLAQFTIVGLDAVAPSQAILAEFKQQNHQFDLVTPSNPDHYGRWGILQEPIKDGAVGTVRIAGIGICLIEGTQPATYPWYAECVDTDSTTLEFNSKGSAQVIYHDDTTKWAIVRIGNTQTTPKGIRIAVVTSTISARSSTTPGSGVVDVVVVSGGLLVTSTPTSLSVKNAYDVSIASGEYLIIAEDAEGDWWAIPKGGGTSSTTKRVRGTIKAYPEPGNNFTAATATDPHTLEDIEGIDGIWSGAAELDIYNPRKHKLWNDTTCEVACEYNETAERWEVYDAQADRIVHGVKFETCQFYELDGASGWHNWSTGHAATWVTEVELSASGCKLEVTKCGDAFPTETTMPYLVSVEVVGAYIQTEDACGTTYNVIELTECPDP